MGLPGHGSQDGRGRAVKPDQPVRLSLSREHQSIGETGRDPVQATYGAFVCQDPAARGGRRSPCFEGLSFLSEASKSRWKKISARMASAFSWYGRRCASGVRGSNQDTGLSLVMNGRPVRLCSTSKPTEATTACTLSRSLGIARSDCWDRRRCRSGSTGPVDLPASGPVCRRDPVCCRPS